MKTTRLSDDLADVAMKFEEFEHGGLTMTGEEVGYLVKAVRMMARRCARLELDRDELLRAAIYERDQNAEQERITRIVNEASRPGSNLIAVNFVAAKQFRRQSLPDGPEGGAA